MRISRKALLAAFLIAAVSLPAAAVAHNGSSRSSDDAFEIHKKGGQDAQHDSATGHLPATNQNAELISKLELTSETGRVADVDYLKGYAYLGAYYEPVCGTGGVWIVDARDPANPKKVGFVKSHTDSYVSEGVQALSIDTPKFTGDLLLYNNESCDKNGVGGVTIVDVTNPARPKKLVEGFGDFTVKGRSQRHANEIHSAQAWDARDKAYAVLVDDEEAKDVDIIDITNPSSPRLISETGISDWPAAGVEGYGEEAFLHDTDVQKFGTRWIMIASYWDAGYVKLDVTNPAAPVFLGDTDYAAVDPEFPGVAPPEGNGHQSDWNSSGQYFAATDEDFSPYRTKPFRITEGEGAGEYDSVSVGGGGSTAELDDHVLNGPVVYGGYGCPDSDPIPLASSIAWPTMAAGEEKIVVLQRGPVGDPSATEEACFPGEKAAQGIEAGYDAVVLVNRHFGSATSDEAYCGSGAFPSGASIPTVCTTHEAFHYMFDSAPQYQLPYTGTGEPAIGSVGNRIEVDAFFDGWGYVHLFDANTLQDLDTYAVAESKNPAYAFGYGDLSVHETEQDPNDASLMYLSYYSAGFRALEIVDNRLVEVASFIDTGGNNFWGLDTTGDTRAGHAGDTMVLLSDRDYGLYIVSYTGQ